MENQFLECSRLSATATLENFSPRRQKVEAECGSRTCPSRCHLRTITAQQRRRGGAAGGKLLPPQVSMRFGILIPLLIYHPAKYSYYTYSSLLPRPFLALCRLRNRLMIHGRVDGAARKTHMCRHISGQEIMTSLNATQPAISGIILSPRRRQLVAGPSVPPPRHPTVLLGT